MHSTQFQSKNDEHVKLTVRPNNDGACVFYLEMEVDNEEVFDLPADFEHVFGDIDKAAHRWPKLFMLAEEEALAEMQRLKAYLQ